MSFLDRIFGDRGDRSALDPLYRAIVEAARDPYWYRDGGVPDTLDGRFDMVSSVLAIVLVRMEGDGEQAHRPAVLLTEAFIDDMDATVRQMGIGDHVVGKHVGRMMGALGGRMAAYREASADAGAFAAAVRRNIFRDAPPSEQAVGRVALRLTEFRGGLEDVPFSELIAGRIRP